MNIDAIFRGPRLKVDRAYAHIDHIESLASNLDQSFFRIAAETEFLLLGQRTIPRHRLRFEPLRPIPESFALIIGDAIHNLRASLDHLASEICWQAQGCSGSRPKPHFPFSKQQKDIARAVGFEVLRAAVKKSNAVMELEVFLNKYVKPYGDGNRDFWSITKLDNDDKHNFVLPAATIGSVRFEYLLVGTHRFFDTALGGDAAGPINLMAITGYDPPNVKGDISASVDLRFPQSSEFFGGEEVIPTLRRLARLTLKCIDDFEALLSGQAN